MAESGGHIYTHAQLAPKSRHVAHAVDDGRRKAYIYYAIREVRASDGMLLHATLCEWIIVMFVRAIDDVTVCAWTLIGCVVVESGKHMEECNRI